MSSIENERLEEKSYFLQKNNFPTNLEAIKGDASKRVFARVQKDNKSYIIIDANPDLGEEPTAYAAITSLLRQGGMNAPEIIAQDLRKGFFLVEDFGDTLFSQLLKSDFSKEKLFYETALEALGEVQKISYQNRVSFGEMSYFIPNYDMNRLLNEARLFTQWYMPAVLKRPLSSIAQDEFTAILKGMMLPIINQPQVLVLRDYHVANLMWQESKKGTKRVGVIDFQDAVWGNKAYDVVSLLQDARRDVAPKFEKEMLEFYQKKFNPSEDFLRDYYLLGLQRNLKILGIFVRLNIRDKKPTYLDHIPLVWRYIDDALEQPFAKPLKDWLDRWLPLSIRHVF